MLYFPNCSFNLSLFFQFNFKPIRVSPPIAQVAVKRGHVLSMYGHAANKVTHCIRPEDIKERRAVIILRHVPDTAPRMTRDDMEHFRNQEEAKKRERPQSPSRANVYIYDHRKFRSSQNERRPRQRSLSPERQRSRSPRRQRSRDWGRERSPLRSRGRSCHRHESTFHGTRARSSDRYRKSDIRFETTKSISPRRRSRSPRRTRRRRRSSSGSDTSFSSDKFDKSFLEPKFRGLTNRTADKILKRKEAETKLRGKSVSEEIKKKVPVSKSVQSGILKTILGSYEDKKEECSSDSSEEPNEEALNKVALDYKKRMQGLKEESSKDRENNENNGKSLEKEVEDLKKELKELKRQFNDNNQDENSFSESESDGEKPVSVLDIFKTTILQKSKKPSYVDRNRKSKVSETRTSKVCKKRIEMLQRKQ